MKNIVELRDALAKVFNDLDSGEVSPKVATEMNNAAGKMINTVKVQLDYAAMCKVEPKIKFLETNGK